MAWNFPSLSRRSFLKATGYGGAALTLLQPIEVINQAAATPTATDAKEDISYTICNFCSSLCNVKVTSRTTNGTKRVVKLDGNPNSTLEVRCAHGDNRECGRLTIRIALKNR